QLDNRNEQLKVLEQEREKLNLVAPCAGTVLPPPQVPSRSLEEAELRVWSGSPIEPENLGATLTVGTKFCEIGDPGRLEARLVIQQGDIDFVQPGQSVAMMMAQSAGYVYVSTVEKKSAEDLKASPTHLSSLNKGTLITQMTAGARGEDDE